ncbi:MAG: hypothetical protein DME26_03555 [Verrucomicrobia bacterium]|nr:MAG: hypothetical protein DME26_03555 [Verrucomicrobiota bacterium]
MISATTPRFREAFAALPKEVQVRARKAYHLWRQNPRHPSLHFGMRQQKIIRQLRWMRRTKTADGQLWTTMHSASEPSPNG